MCHGPDSQMARKYLLAGRSLFVASHQKSRLQNAVVPISTEPLLTDVCVFGKKNFS